MVTGEDVRTMVSSAEHDPQLMRSLKNLLNPDYRLDKYYDFDVAIESEYPGLVKLWGIDLHCYKLYTKYAKELNTTPGEQLVLRTLADAHKFSIRKDMRDISDILHGEYDDFSGLEGQYENPD